MGRFNDLANRLSILQRGFMDQTQKRKNGNFSAGTSGINLDKSHTMEWSPSTGAGGYAQGYAQVMGASQAAQKSNPSGGMTATATGAASPTKDWSTGDWGGFLNAYGAANKSVTDAGTPTGSGAPGNVAPEHQSDAQKLLTQLEQLMNQKFEYDYKTDPGYLAAVDQANQAGKDASKQTMETMNDRGIFNSSITTSQLGQIEQKAKLAPMQLVPGLEANAYNRFQSNISNQAGMLQSMLQQENWATGFERDQKWHDEDTKWRDDQSAEDKRWREADLTGTYESPEMLKLMEDIVGAKQGWAGTTDVNERKKYADAGKSARAALAGLTGRSTSEIEKLFGGTVGVDQARAGFGLGGVETVAGRSARVADERYNNEWAYQKDQDVQAQKNWEKQYDLSVFNSRKAASGGGGGGGPTYAQMLSGNAHRMATVMLSEINSPDEVSGWIKQNRDDILAAGVDPSVFFAAAEDAYKNQQPAPAEKPFTREQILSAAQKDVDWDKAKTWEEQLVIIRKYENYYNGPQNTPGQGGGQGGGTALDKIYGYFSGKFPSYFGGSSKPPAPSGGGKSSSKPPAPSGGGKTRGNLK